MNILGLVFSLLLIFSYGFYACWDKQTASHRLRTTYIAHEKANRQILNSYQSEIYNHQWQGKATSKPGKKELSDEDAQKSPSVAVKKLDPNRECAKLNLWPLIQEGRENHPALYKLTARLIRTFYGSFEHSEKQFEYHFLDAILSSARTFPQNCPFAFEKILLKDYQPIFYKMLKGTKEWDLDMHTGYPPLLDYIKATPVQDKICLFHAHPDLLIVLFGHKVAAKFYPVMHQKKGPALTREWVEKFCSGAHLGTEYLECIELLEFGHPRHRELKKSFVAVDTCVSLRKTVYLYPNNPKN